MIEVINDAQQQSKKLSDEDKPPDYEIAVRGLIDSPTYTRFKVNWLLTNFTREFVKNSKNRSYLASELFEVVVGTIKTTWWIQLYPNGDYSQEYFAIYLRKKHESSMNYDMRVTFEIMKGHKGVHSAQTQSYKAELVQVNAGRGFSEFLSHQDLFRHFSNYIEASSLHIQVNVELSIAKTAVGQGEIYLHQTVKNTSQ